MLSFNIGFDSNKSGVINGNAQLCVLQIIFGVVVLFNKIPHLAFDVPVFVDLFFFLIYNLKNIIIIIVYIY